jgi:diguanylate cyclase (GGDEF)-like protein
MDLDHTELRWRARSVALGSRLTLAAIAVAGVYVAASPAAPHRGVLALLLGAAATWALVPIAIGTDRIARSARREPLLLGWTLGMLVLAGSLAALDGGVRSPLTLLLFVPLALAALSYPPRSVATVVAAAVLVVVAAGHATAGYAALFASYLVITATLCAWEARDQGRQRRALTDVSRADPLTDCLNRRGFQERLDAELDSASRANTTFALVVLDLDDFKAVNDTYGHAAGDELLRWTVERVSRVLRPMDSLGRLGGDEFAILVPGADRATGGEVAGRVCAVLAERAPASIGMAAFPLDGADRDALHRCADADLYAAKHGRAAGSRDETFATALASAVNLRMAAGDAERSISVHAVAMAERLGMSAREIAMLRLAAILHDVGKVSVPDWILTKPGPLTVDEFEHVKTHAAAGADIIAHVDGLSEVAKWIRHSHEHVDGSGYPAGLSGDAIPLGSRVLFVADAYEAMTSERPYGTPLPPDIALAELRLAVGTQFDARCVAALEDYLAEHPLDLRARRFGRAPLTAA